VELPAKRTVTRDRNTSIFSPFQISQTDHL
jgi:hypothetical protein